MSASAAAVLADPYDAPPLVHRAGGGLRRVGVELEFMGLAAAPAAHALAAAFGGTVESEDAHAWTVRASSLGDLGIELDLRHAHPQRHAGTLRWRLGRRGAALLGVAARRVVPHELITPPLPLDRLHEVERAVAVLAAAGAATPRRPLAGVPGLHLNVDLPADPHTADDAGDDTGTLAAYLKAYVLLEPWLRRETLAPWADGPGLRAARASLPPAFPAAYVAGLLAAGDGPAAAFATAYLDANPSRDRGLDLLPVLMHRHPDLVRSRLPHEKINPRSALHVRLPLARVGEPGWSPASDWNRWVLVERLATDAGRLAELADRWATAAAIAGSGDAAADAWLRELERSGTVPAAAERRGDRGGAPQAPRRVA